MSNSVSVLLSIHKRPHVFESQINCLIDQTKKIDQIMVWCSSIDHVELIQNIQSKYALDIQYGITNVPGVWGRFGFALNTDTDFVYIMDDDLFPGKKYIQRCIDKFYEYEGCVISPSGLKFAQNPSSFYTPYVRYGWTSYPTTEHEDHEVDYGQHGWFIHREFLSYFWKNLPDVTYSKFAGEDMHVSHMLSKYTHHKTIVLKHDTNEDFDLWSNNPNHEYFLTGADHNGISYNKGIVEMNDVIMKKIKEGWLN